MDPESPERGLGAPEGPHFGRARRVPEGSRTGREGDVCVSQNPQNKKSYTPSTPALPNELVVPTTGYENQYEGRPEAVLPIGRAERYVSPASPTAPLISHAVRQQNSLQSRTASTPHGGPRSSGRPSRDLHPPTSRYRFPEDAAAFDLPLQCATYKAELAPHLDP